MTCGQDAGKAPAAQNTDTHPFLICSKWLSVETLDMHCTVVGHRRHCFRRLKKKALSPNSARRVRFDSCIRQFGPSRTTRLCLQHQHTGNNPSLAKQLHAEQTSQSSYLAKRILTVVRLKHMWHKEEICIQRSSITIWQPFQHVSEHQGKQVRQ